MQSDLKKRLSVKSSTILAVFINIYLLMFLNVMIVCIAYFVLWFCHIISVNMAEKSHGLEGFKRNLQGLVFIFSGI